jgi:3-keto-L-gulonate-6-phosphate decarboxylase
MANEKLDREELINMIWRVKGKMSLAAEQLGVDPATIFNYAKKYATVQEAINRARQTWDERLLDLAEVKLFDQVQDGRAWAIKYVLTNKGRDRGYYEKHEVVTVHNIDQIFTSIKQWEEERRASSTGSNLSPD